MADNGTIDITDFVEQLRTTFVDWATAYIFGLEVAVPELSWVALPIINVINKALIKEVLEVLSRSAVMQAFFTNTAIRKASQAQDFQDAVDAKLSLPSTATKDEYEAAEKAQMAAFRSLVMVTN